MAAPTAETVPPHQPGGGGGPLRVESEPGCYFPAPGRSHELPCLPEAVSWSYTLLGRVRLTLYQVRLERSGSRSVICALCSCRWWEEPLGGGRSRARAALPEASDTDTLEQGATWGPPGSPLGFCNREGVIRGITLCLGRVREDTKKDL